MAIPIPLMLMAGGSALASIMGAREAGAANRTNNAISLRNFYAQEQARQDAITESKRQQAEGKLGTTDAQGNRRHYVEGVGWVTTLTPEQEQLQKLSNSEMLRQLTDGARRNALNEKNAADRRLDDNVMADEASRAMRSERRVSPMALREQDALQNRAAHNKSADALSRAMAMRANRAGTNTADIMQTARAASDANFTPVNGSVQQYRGTSDAQFNNNQGSGSNLYNYFKSAGQTGTSAPGRMNIRGPETRSTGSADQTLANALGRSTMQDYSQADHSMSGLIGGLTNAANTYYNANQNSKMSQAMIDHFGRQQG